MTKPLFSVVIPTHNGEAYIALAIESVLAQSYPHFEIIILEHESTDNTVKIVRSYRDPRIRLYSTSQPQTIESNWARMLDIELAEFLTILGHDDIFYPEFLQEMTTLIAQEPGSSLYLTHFHIIDSDGVIIRPCKPMPYQESGEAFMQARQHFKRDSFGTGYVMRSADYKRVGGFPAFKQLIYADDFVFYRLADLSGKTCSPQHLFGYRSHQKSEGYISGLETLKEASQQFVTALEGTPYAKNPANLALTNHYINTAFTRRYIRILIHLLQKDERTQFQYYRSVRDDFRRQFPDHSWSSYNVIAGAINLFIAMPHSSIQKLVSKILSRILARARGTKN